MRQFPVVFSILAAVAMLLAGVATAAAQDATPMASPVVGTCDAPELPPGTPTPMEEGTPMAEAAATPDDMAAMATPAGEEPPAVEEAPAAPMGTPADAAVADAAEAGFRNLINCVNGGDYLAAAALMTDNFIQNFLEVPTPYDAAADFEGVQPMDIRSVGNAQTYDDGSVSVDVVYAGFFNAPGALSGERWFFVEEDGYYKLDNIGSGPMPEGVLPGATVVDVQMVDYAFALDSYTLPANTPLIFRNTNNSGSGAPHENVVVQLVEGATAEAVIEGQVDLDDEANFAGFYGRVFLEPGDTGDLAFESLAPGTYFLVCGVETADGTPHYELGMVAEVTVE